MQVSLASDSWFRLSSGGAATLQVIEPFSALGLIFSYVLHIWCFFFDCSKVLG